MIRIGDDTWMEVDPYGGVILWSEKSSHVKLNYKEKQELIKQLNQSDEYLEFKTEDVSKQIEDQIVHDRTLS